MFVVDTNVLIYAANRSCSEHGPCLTASAVAVATIRMVRHMGFCTGSHPDLEE
jgi:predicted nucleic acid-binding protein